MNLKNDIAQTIKQAFARGIHTSYEEVAEDVIAYLKGDAPLIDLFRAPEPDGISARLLPVIHAEFETSGGGLTGKQAAKVKRVEHQDDGSLTVVIDHWPNVASLSIPGDPMLRLGLALKDALPKEFETGTGWYNLSAKVRRDETDFYVTNLTVRPGKEMKNTDLSQRMRTLAAQPAYAAVKTILTQGADEIDRYYTASVNWKASAEAKDRAALLNKTRESLSEPDRAAIQDKRMSELTPDQQDDAMELWLRDQIGWFNEDTQRHLKFLLERLSKTRREALSMKEVYADLQNVKESVNVVQAERQKLQTELAVARSDFETLLEERDRFVLERDRLKTELNIATAERKAYRDQSEARRLEIEKLLATNQELRNECNTAMQESRNANHKYSVLQGSLELDGLEVKHEGDGSITIINHDLLKAETELESLKNEFHTLAQERDDLKSKMMMFPATDLEYFTDLLKDACQRQAFGDSVAEQLMKIIRQDYRGPAVKPADPIMKTVAEVTAYINKNRDKLLMAWLAENEANPSDVVMVTQIEWGTHKEICWFEHKDKHRG
jgi:hypothetical protein